MEPKETKEDAEEEQGGGSTTCPFFRIFSFLSAIGREEGVRCLSIDDL
jgi:hypothetical protein